MFSKLTEPPQFVDEKECLPCKSCFTDKLLPEMPKWKPRIVFSVAQIVVKLDAVPAVEL